MAQFFTQLFGKESIDDPYNTPIGSNQAFSSLFYGVYTGAQAVMRIALMVAVVVAIIMFVIYGVMYAMSSKGQQHDQAKQRIMRGILAVAGISMVSSGVLLVFNILWT